MGVQGLGFQGFQCDCLLSQPQQARTPHWKGSKHRLGYGLLRAWPCNRANRSDGAHEQCWMQARLTAGKLGVGWCSVGATSRRLPTAAVANRRAQPNCGPMPTSRWCTQGLPSPPVSTGKIH